MIRPRRRDLLCAGLGLSAVHAHAAVNDVNCIVLFMTGGPSQLDTWDPKPDAPSHIRGPFQAIATNVPGIRISENFPRMAKLADKYAIIRSVHHTAPADHDSGREAMLRDLPMESCVMVDMFDTVFHRITWDIHGFKPFSPIGCYRDRVGPMFDQMYSSLLTDLDERGLLASTIVLAMGEFGRTPKINPAGGRDHWPECFSVLIAGGPIQGGQVIGSSDAIGAEPRDRPVTPAEIAATVRGAMGLPLPGGGAQPIRELLA